MEAENLVSIIITNYNYARFVGEAIDSALSQKRQEVEVIVVDDGSTDDSRDVISNYGSNVAKVFQENCGQAGAFNAGFRLSRGGTIIFLDADDILEDSAAFSAAKTLENRDVVNVCWQLRKTDEHGAFTGLLYPTGELARGRLREKIIRTGPVSKFPPTSGNAWARDYIDRVMPIRGTSDKHGADAYLSCLAPLYGLVHWLPTPQSRYRCHAEQYTANCPRLRLERNLKKFDIKSELIREHLGRQNVDVDPSEWKKSGSPYQWMRDMIGLFDEIQEIVTPSDKFILLDEDQLGTDFFSPLTAVPLAEQDGLYAGIPVNDEEVMGHLYRHFQSGCRYLVAINACFWWFDHFRTFKNYLHASSELLLSNERVMMYRLHREP